MASYSSFSPMLPTGICLVNIILICDIAHFSQNGSPTSSVVSMHIIYIFKPFTGVYLVEYSQRHNLMFHCDGCITHPDYLDISVVLFIITSKTVVFRMLLVITKCIRMQVNTLNRAKGVLISPR
jgi:hypothetical protein